MCKTWCICNKNNKTIESSTQTSLNQTVLSKKTKKLWALMWQMCYNFKNKYITYKTSLVLASYPWCQKEPLTCPWSTRDPSLCDASIQHPTDLRYFKFVTFVICNVPFAQKIQVILVVWSSFHRIIVWDLVVSTSQHYVKEDPQVWRVCLSTERDLQHFDCSSSTW